MAGLYVHIPFCKSKCIYCDFYSMPNELSRGADYVSALLAEAAMRCDELKGEKVATLYVGGGTPSLLGNALCDRLVNGLRQVFDLSHLEEFTIEVNPDDVSEEKIRFFKSIGVNRVSMGVQSFSDKELRLINRRHDSAQAVQAIRRIYAAGITNVSIDLIYGIPGQDMNTWMDNVEKAITLHPTHISAYSMMYEKGTLLTAMRDAGKVKEVAEEEVSAMYDALVERMKAYGYQHYEISNFCMPGYASRHNSSYWSLTPYLGLGVAAHSYDGVSRRYNPSQLHRYIAAIKAGESFYETETSSEQERYDEYVMLRLRTAEGLHFADLESRFGTEFSEFFMQKAKALITQGLLCETGGNYFIPETRVMLTDMITCELLWEE